MDPPNYKFPIAKRYIFLSIRNHGLESFWMGGGGSKGQRKIWSIPDQKLRVRLGSQAVYNIY